MNPSSHETSVTPPAPELPAPANAPEAGAQAPERAAAPAEKMPVNRAPAAAAMPMPSLPAPPQLAPNPATIDDASTTKKPIRSVVKDRDLIDKTWVERAKRIIEQTHDDPYKQNEQLTAEKAEYLRHSYDKVIKLSK